MSLIVARLLLAYVVAGAALVMYLRRSLEAHAHVPFSGFPEFLIWSPLAPALILSEFSAHRIQGVISLLVFGAVFGLAGWLLLRRWRQPAT